MKGPIVLNSRLVTALDGRNRHQVLTHCYPFAAGSGWVSNTGTTIIRIDPATGRTLATISVNGGGSNDVRQVILRP